MTTTPIRRSPKGGAREEPSPRPPGRPAARIPLPAKTERRHGDATKYERARQKEALRRERDDPPGRGGS
jgi:hypothetical protein